MRRIEAADIKARYTVLDVWRMLMPHSCPAKDGVYHSPFRDDRNPSFSVYDNGRKFKDHSNDSHSGDAIDFAKIATGLSTGEAIKSLSSGISTACVIPPPPPRRKMPLISNDHEKFEQESKAGWDQWYSRNSIEYDNSVFSRLLINKKIDIKTASSLHNEGSLGVIDGKPVYISKYGIKIRHEAETSRSSRWLCGKPHGFVWRNHILYSPSVKHVIITESETDLMRLSAIMPQGISRLIVSAPSAAWRPSSEYVFFIGAHRSVTIWFDNDSSGISSSERIEQEFLKVKTCKFNRVLAEPYMEKDICAMREEDVRFLAEKFVLT